MGGRRPSTLFTGGGAPAAGPFAPGQRWSVVRKRMLQVMREPGRRSPHRGRPSPLDEHDRRIVAAAPNSMGAIDGPQISAVRDGKGGLFATVEHGNAEALGWQVSQRCTRRAARQARAMAVREQGDFGPTPDTANMTLRTSP